MTSPIVAKLRARPDLLAGAEPPISDDQLVATEAAVGFRLPETLRDIYLHVANGGFGPHIQGFMGGVGGARPDGGTIVELYRAMRSDPERFTWPNRLLPFFEWGCACRCALDCTEPDGAVVYCDPSGIDLYFADDDPGYQGDPVFEDVLPTLRHDADTLEQWLDRWLAGHLGMCTSHRLWVPKDAAALTAGRRGRKMTAV